MKVRIKMTKYIFSFLFLATSLFAENKTDLPKVDCLILEDENSIICKYEVIRINKSRDVLVQWIDPKGEVSRTRNMNVPAGHGSIYDYRYIKGRTLGVWTFKVTDSEKNEYTTQFELK